MSQSKISEGKTKIIWETDDPNLVRIESKDDITAGDGARKDFLKGKAKLATQTTVNVFNLLKANGIPTHFVSRDSDTSFIAKRAKMIPLECVARRIAAGSALFRNPKFSEGQRFHKIPVEFYLKDDLRHDPIMRFDKSREYILLFNPKDSVKTRKPIGKITLTKLNIAAEELIFMEKIARKVFKIVEKSWKEKEVALVDMKIEFGKDRKGNLMVADVIDNDSWRIWSQGKKEKMLDKQRYRNGEELSLILSNYRQVAEMTQAFPN